MKKSLPAILSLLSFSMSLHAATPYNMSSADYAEDFANIATWTADFASGTGAAPWGSVALNATGTIPDGQRTSASTVTAPTSSSGSTSVQKGTGNLVFLTTGTTDNAAAIAVDLFLDFTGRTAGTLSFEYGQANNTTGNRAASLRVYTSTDGTTWTELTAAIVTVTNNFSPVATGSRSAIALPVSFDGSATARIRFYEYNGPAVTSPTGSRPKIAIDNIAVTSAPGGGGTAASIATQPTSATVLENGTTNFTVVAAGTAPFTYQWQREGTNLPTATTNVLTFASAQFSHAGSYQVIVDNAYGDAVTSSVVTLTVSSNAPSITVQPQSQNVISGTNVTFTITATGSAPLSYQWKKNGSDVSNATNTSLVVSNVTEVDAGNYTCTVSNNAAVVTSSTAVLQINANFVTVMTYNVKGNGVSDFSTNTAKIQALGRQLVYLEPDIIMFQEIPSGQLTQVVEIVNAYLPGYYYATNSATDGFIRSAIVSRWSITRSEKWLVSADLDPFGYATSDFTRDLFEAEINVPGFAQPFHAFTTHLKSGSSTDECNKRAAEASCISNFFVTSFLTTNSTHPYVLTGDLNEDINRAPGPSQQPIQKLVSSPTGLFLTTPTNFFDTSSSNDMTFSIQSLPLAHRYDYILPCGTLYSNQAGSQVFRTDLLSPLPGGLNASDSATAADHLPVLMTFSNPNTASPTIIAQPSSLTNAAGTTAIFSVSAGGATPLIYQWYKGATPLSDGGNISGATSTSLTISSLLSTDAGSYSVTITNSIGSTNSAAVTLTVIDPAVTSQPTNTTVNPGTTATFSVTAGGTAPLTYQWRKSGVDLLDGVDISGATTTTLTLSNVTTNNEGSYSVLVSNSVSTALSSNAFLNVRTPPVITAQPTNRTVNAGVTNVVSVTATGTSIAYQWRKNGTPLSDGGIVSGATTRFLTLSGVYGVDAGNYSVVVSNAVDVVTSSDAALTVIDPFISSQPTSVSTNLGSTATFSVVAAGTAPLSYQWKKNGSDLGNGGNIAGATSASLTVSTIAVSDGASYSVVVSNTQGTATSSSAVLSVTSAGGEVYLSSTSYLQDFDSMGTSSTAPLPGGWKMSGPAGAAAPTYLAAGNFTAVSQAANSGSPTAGGRYNWGNGTSTSDRAPGFMSSGSYASPNSLLAGFQNNNVSNITELSVSFDIERYRTNMAAAAVTFFLSTDGTNWTAYTAGDSGAFDTAASAYSFLSSTIFSRSLTISNLSIPTNTTFYLRWNFNTTGGNSQGLGLDNVSMTAGFTVPPPSLGIASQPVSQTVWENTNVTFSVAATGSAPFSYQWFFDGNLITDETNATLNLTAVTTNDSGPYFVTVSNEAGTTNSDTVTLTVNPAISTNIAYLRTLLDGVNWTPTDTTNIYRVEGTVVTHTNISGASDASFYLQDNTAGIAVFITGGSAIRPTAGDIVRVTGNLNHFNGLLQFALNASNPTHSVAVLSSGNPLPSATSLALSTQTNTALIDSLEGSRIVISGVFIDLTSPAFATNTTIKLTNAYNLAETIDMRIDARVGDFQGQIKPTNAVSITGVLGQFDTNSPRTSGYQLIPTRFADVVSIDPPAITNQPDSVLTNVNQGASVTFEVGAEGGALMYQWRTNGTAISGATDSSYTISSVQPSDSSNTYSVVVSNPGDSVTSSNATIAGVIVDTNIPTVTVLTPKLKSGTNQALINVTGQVKDKKGALLGPGIITSVTIVHNKDLGALGSTNAGNLVNVSTLTAGVWNYSSPGPVTAIPGTNTLHVYAVDLAGNVSTLAPSYYYYDVTNSLTLEINGTGQVKALGTAYSANTVLGNYKVGRPYYVDALVGAGTNYVFTNWTVGPTNLTNQYITMTNWTQKSKLTFLMQPNMTITANFIANPFTPVAGIYNGLFAESEEDGGVRHESAGFVTMKVGAKSEYSGYLIFDGDSKVPFSGKFTASGDVSRDVTRAVALGKPPVRLSLTIDSFPNSASGEINGTVTNGTWTSILKADIAKYDAKALVLDTTTNFTGTYTMQIPRGTGYPTQSPGGVGYGTITNNTAGIIALLGRMGDSGPKQTIGQKVNIGRHGDWPLYVGLYPSTVTFNNAFTGNVDKTNKSYYLGAMMGWVKFSSNNASVPPTNKPTGDVVWIKKATDPSLLLKTPTNAVYYTNGFSNELTLATAPYVMPGLNEMPIKFTSGEVVVSDGNLSEPITNTTLLIATNKVSLSLKTTNSALEVATNKMAIAFTKKSGEFKGSWVGTNLLKTEFFGVLLQDTTNASGHFLGTTNSGHVLFYGQ